MQLCVLGNLCPETVEEAIAMVPSIKVYFLPVGTKIGTSSALNGMLKECYKPL